MHADDQLRLCDFNNANLTCPACGYVAKRPKTFRRCTPVPGAVWQPVDVGALVERALTSIGITKERVEALTRTAGEPGGCGCDARKKWLTEVGNRVQRTGRDVLLKMRDLYGFGK